MTCIVAVSDGKRAIMGADSLVLVVDPGLRATGLALFERETLVAAHLARSKPSGSPEPDVAGAVQVAEDAAAWVRVVAPGRSIVAVVIEWPRVWRGSAENPNDLLPLTLVEGLIISLLGSILGYRPIVIPVLADRWTKGVPKKIRQLNFLDPARKHLTSTELAILEKIQPASLRHNVVDSVHLGKWATAPLQFASLMRDFGPRPAVTISPRRASLISKQA